ncbi:MAG TPA: methylated-DNA--[protein]-cysteine S-methyltransferase [Anaerolineae bacterium]|nr:methylated-DNA--[protein]-cysteine S-methyltransferase [Anaerolineae bacterium]
MMSDFEQERADYERIAAAIRFIEVNFQRQPSLAEMAEAVHLSPYHFQRLFKRWAGVSPTQFCHFLTVDYAKEQLAAAETVWEAAVGAGLSGSGRLHDLFVTHEAMTPGEYKRAGKGLVIRYGGVETPFGEAVLAVTERGICGLRFVTDGVGATVAALQAEWDLATWREDVAGVRPWAAAIFSREVPDKPLPLLLKGTNFQIQVWRALLAIPEGRLVTYGDVAAKLGRPRATRAVGTAIGRNGIGYLIPCHRVINKSGRGDKYRWGGVRKRAMIGYEASVVME